MNKLVLVLATAATFGFGTAAFAASPSTASTQERVLKASHARHYRHDNGKKVAVKHVPANRTARTKASS